MLNFNSRINHGIWETILRGDDLSAYIFNNILILLFVT